MKTISRLLITGFVPLLAAGVLAGCSSTGPYSAGRMPYGGPQKLANHDPFAGATEGKRGANADRPNANTVAKPEGIDPRNLVSWNERRATTPDDYSAPPATDSNWTQNPTTPTTRQAAYHDPSNGNPFAGTTTASSTPPMATAVADSNPFAAVEGQPVTTTSRPVSGGFVQQTPSSGSSGDVWYTETAAASPSNEEFLPPIR